MAGRPNGDDLSDFFDLSKPFKIVTIRGGSSRRDKTPKEDEFFEKDDLEVEDTRNYFEKYQKSELDRMKNSCSASNASVYDGPRHSAMSAIEVDTIGPGSSIFGGAESTVGGASTRTARDRLLEKFDFAHVDKNAQELPVSKYKEEIMDKINAYPVVIVSGQTGCGKTTQIPQYIVEHNAKRSRYVNVIVTQPRRLAAQSVARRVCAERGWSMGHLVGYKVGLDKVNCSPDTRLMYCTTGVLKKMLIAKKSLTEWTHVILDEVHEREEDMDFLLLLCRRFITSNSQGVKLILMSATMKADKYSDYFSWAVPNVNFVLCQATIVEIHQPNKYQVSIFYLDDLKAKLGDIKGPQETESPQLNRECVVICRNILENLVELEKHDTENYNSQGAALIFLPGEAEISTVKSALKESPQASTWWILPLHSRIPFEDAQEIFRTKPNYRKIILATNIAESSVTIPDISYVIDFCLTKNIMTDPETNYVSLKLMWADKNSCRQRTGRSGRVKEGRVFRLVFRDFYENVLPDEHLPEMQRAPLDKVILDTKLLDFGSPVEVLALALDPPDLGNISTTVMHLKEIGALLPTVTRNVNQLIECVPIKDDGDLTVLGEIIASLPVDVRLGKLIVLGHLLDILEECIIIAAGLSNKSIFTTPFDQKLRAFANKLIWADRSFSDCLAVYLAFKVWSDKKRKGAFAYTPASRGDDPEQKWCRQRFLQLKALREMEMTIDEIKRSLKRFGIEPLNLPNRPDRQARHGKKTTDDTYMYIKFAIFGAFYPNYFVRTHGGLDLRDVHRQINNRDPMNTLYLTGFPSEQAKFGQLYSGQIKELFKDCQPNPDMIDVEFDNRKVIVSFAKCQVDGYSERVSLYNTDETVTNFTHDIIHQVYVGMKLKNIPIRKPCIKTHSVEKAKELMNEYQDMNKRKGPIQLTKAEKVGQVEPPSLDMEYVNFVVVHITSPGSFFVNYTDTEHNLLHDKLQSAISFWSSEGMCAERHRVQSPLQVKVGHVYLSMYKEDGNYYRSRVDHFHMAEQKVTVFYLDYGNVERIEMEELVIIQTDVSADKMEHLNSLVHIPALALECSLAHVKPNPMRSVNGEWDEVASKVYEQLLVYLTSSQESGLKFNAQIYSVIQGSNRPIVKVILYLEDHPVVGKSESVNIMYQREKDAKRRPFAVEAAESFLSMQSHETRANERTFSADLKEMLEERQKMYFGFNPSWNINETGHVETILKGPYHPLEFNISSAHRVGDQKPVRIEMDSVNSVLLDDHPTDTNDQWLVAAHVGLNPAGSTLLARSTTFMPNRPGLGAILTMIFAPSVEMRCDKSFKRYTGCLAGLGSRPYGWKPYVDGVRKQLKTVAYNPDHDMEIQFDVNIDNRDIQLINKIRYSICHALSRVSSGKVQGATAPLPLEVQRTEGMLRMASDDALVEVQDKLKDCLDTLFNVQRNAKTKEMFSPEYRWDQNKERRLPTPVTDEEQLFLKMITGIQLKGEQ